MKRRERKLGAEMSRWERERVEMMTMLLPMKFYPFSYILNEQCIVTELQGTHREITNKISCLIHLLLFNICDTVRKLLVFIGCNRLENPQAVTKT